MPSSELNLLIATTLTQVGVGGVAGFATGWGVRKVVAFAVKIVAGLFALTAVFLAALQWTGIIQVNWSRLVQLTEQALTSLANGLLTALPTLIQWTPATGSFGLGAAVGFLKQ